jgi:hypothetical protein
MAKKKNKKLLTEEQKETKREKVRAMYAKLPDTYKENMGPAVKDIVLTGEAAIIDEKKKIKKELGY